LHKRSYEAPVNHTPAGCEAAGAVGAQEVDAVMVATRVLVAVSAQSVASVEDHITLPQLRVLVMIATQAGLELVHTVTGHRRAAIENFSPRCQPKVAATWYPRYWPSPE
jgi:hypothetical protein